MGNGLSASNMSVSCVVVGLCCFARSLSQTKLFLPMLALGLAELAVSAERGLALQVAGRKVRCIAGQGVRVRGESIVVVLVLSMVLLLLLLLRMRLLVLVMALGVLLRLLLLLTKLLGHVHVHLEALVAIAVEQAMLIEHGKSRRVGAGRAIGRGRVLRVKGNALGRGDGRSVPSMELTLRLGLVEILAGSLEPEGTIGHLGMQSGGRERRATASSFLQH